MSPGRRFALALGGIVAITALGTAGYVLIEGMSLIDAPYMTVATIATVRFGAGFCLPPVGIG